MNLVAQKVITAESDEQQAIEVELMVLEAYADRYGNFAEAIREFEQTHGKMSVES